jgi:hypothetical protein
MSGSGAETCNGTNRGMMRMVDSGSGVRMQFCRP